MLGPDRGVNVQRGRNIIGSAALAVSVLIGVTAGPASGVANQAAPAGQEHAQDHGADGLDLDARGRGRPGAAAAPYDVDGHALWSPSQWDGAAFTTDQPDVTTLPQFHAIYMHPYGTTSRFAQFAAMIQADARQASDRLVAALGRAVRWDTRAGGFVDVTVVTSSSVAKGLGGPNQFNVVRNELVARGFTNPNKKYVVWLDAGSLYCGQGELYQDVRRSAANWNELRTTAIVYRPYPTSDPVTGGFCRGRTALHEMGHNMGALQLVAPHAFDGAHCNDSGEDVMCYTSATSNDTGLPAFDYRNDDYWDPLPAKLAWWTVNLSRYVCPAAGCASPATPAY
jgi:hypothetical protein